MPQCARADQSDGRLNDRSAGMYALVKFPSKPRERKAGLFVHRHCCICGQLQTQSLIAGGSAEPLRHTRPCWLILSRGGPHICPGSTSFRAGGSSCLAAGTKGGKGNPGSRRYTCMWCNGWRPWWTQRRDA